MRINYCDFNIKQIYYKDKKFNVKQFYCDYNGIRLYFEGDKFLNEFIFDNEQKTIDILKCITIDDSKITLFEVFFTILIDGNGNFLAHIKFNRVVTGFLENYPINCNKMRVVLDNKKYIISDFFEFESVEIENRIILTLSHNFFEIKSVKMITSDYIIDMFFKFYEYFNLLCGFFPNIKNIYFYSGKKVYEYMFNISEKYITKQIYIKNDLFFTSSLNQTDFLTSYNAFLKLRKKAELSFDIYYCSMMQTNIYPEVAIVNLLQSFDGLFNKLTIFKDKQYLFKNSIKEKLIKRYCDLDISDISGLDAFDRERIKGLLGYINKPSFSMKIRHILNVSERIFETEKKTNISEEKKYFDILLKKFINTRNKFSHSSAKNNKYLDGTESALYIMKLFLTFRICVMKEIKINIQSTLLNDYIQKLDIYFNKKLQIFNDD